MVEVVKSIADKTRCHLCDDIHAVGKEKHSDEMLRHGTYGDTRRVECQTHTGCKRLTDSIKTIDNTTPTLILISISSTEDCVDKQYKLRNNFDNYQLERNCYLKYEVKLLNILLEIIKIRS